MDTAAMRSEAFYFCNSSSTLAHPLCWEIYAGGLQVNSDLSVILNGELKNLVLEEAALGQ